VTHLLYLALLAGCLLGTAPLEIFLHTRVYARWCRLLAAILPAAVLFSVWDSIAISRGQWSYQSHWIVGVSLGRLPLEELLFFLVIPTCAILTLEAVRARRPQWSIGDEPTGSGPGPA
jgi:lycopene cyclase domain-containing protein